MEMCAQGGRLPTQPNSNTGMLVESTVNPQGCLSTRTRSWPEALAIPCPLEMKVKLPLDPELEVHPLMVPDATAWKPRSTPLICFELYTTESLPCSKVTPLRSLHTAAAVTTQSKRK